MAHESQRPSMRSAQRSNLRRRAEAAYREYRALLILTDSLGAADRRLLDDMQDLGTLPRPKLQERYASLKENVRHVRGLLGATKPSSEYEQIVGYLSSDDTRQILYVPKYLIRELFEHYERLWPLFDALPLHGRIAIDVTGRHTPAARALHWSLLEATLFEDLALLWNQMLDADERYNRDSSVASNKWLDALLRATSRAAFHLLEGYLNGLAFDVVLTHPLSEHETKLLLEWDQDKNRAIRLSLREKVLQYPKLATRADHPPIQESNCKEMQFVLEREEMVRHALVHPTPRVETWHDSRMREHVFFDLKVDDVKQIVDSVLMLIRRVGLAVGSRFGRVDIWLYERGSDGRFPDQAFH